MFLTGATGFLGRRVAKAFAASGWRVVGLARTKPSEQSRNVEFVAGDLLNPAAYRNAVSGCDAIVHLAAATGKHSPAEYSRTNRDGTAALVQAAENAGITKLLYISTIGVKFRDLSRYPYAKSKLEAEQVVKNSGLCWTIVRPTMIFGPGSPVLEGFRKLAALPWIPIFGSGRAAVQPISVDDLAGAIVKITESGGFSRQTMELGGPEVISVQDLIIRLRGPNKAKTIHLPAEPIAAFLALIEPVFRSLLPVTAGQLASFTNDGIAVPDAHLASLQAGMRTLDQMLLA